MPKTQSACLPGTTPNDSALSLVKEFGNLSRSCCASRACSARGHHQAAGQHHTTRCDGVLQLVLRIETADTRCSAGRSGQFAACERRSRSCQCAGPTSALLALWHAQADPCCHALQGSLFAVLSRIGFDTFDYATPLQKLKLKLVGFTAQLLFGSAHVLAHVSSQAENFLEFRRGEVYQAVQAELAHENVAPVEEGARQRRCVSLMLGDFRREIPVPRA